MKKAAVSQALPAAWCPVSGTIARDGLSRRLPLIPVVWAAGLGWLPAWPPACSFALLKPLVAQEMAQWFEWCTRPSLCVILWLTDTVTVTGMFTASDVAGDLSSLSQNHFRTQLFEKSPCEKTQSKGLSVFPAFQLGAAQARGLLQSREGQLEGGCGRP